MKSAERLDDAARGALKNSINSSESIFTTLKHLRDGNANDADVLPGLRKLLGELTKAIHEYSAYKTARMTD